MATEGSDAAAEAAKRALKVGSAMANAITFGVELGQELPFVGPVLKTMNALREKASTVKRNRKELAAMEKRCRCITECIVKNPNRMPTSEMNLTPLNNCIEAVVSFAELCQDNRRGRCTRWLNASDDQDIIARLNTRIDRASGDLQLAGYLAREETFDNLKEFPVSC